MTKDAAGYTDKASGERRCGGCGMYHDNRTCDLVDGRISPEGWCRHWIKPSPKRIVEVGRTAAAR